MAIELTKDKWFSLLDNFTKNTNFYNRSKFKKVRKVIAERHNSDYEVLERISVSKESRQLLSSSELIENIVVSINSQVFPYHLNSRSQDLIFLISFFESHENEYISNSIALKSIAFLNNATSIFEEEIVKQEKSNQYKNEMTTFFVFFSYIIDFVKIDKEYENLYQNLFQKLDSLLVINNYQYTEFWFRFYFHLRNKNLTNYNIESNVISQVVTMIRNINKSEKTKNIIESYCSIPEFIKINSSFQKELVNKSLNSLESIKVFYTFFDNENKKKVIEYWIDKSSKQAKEAVISNIKHISDKIGLANKIINRANGLNNNLIEKKEFLNLLFFLKLSRAQMLSTNYSEQIGDLIFNTQRNFHDFGIRELKEHRGFIDTGKYKLRAEKFINLYFNSLSGNYVQIQNILNNRLGITKKVLDKFINNDRNRFSVINNHLVSTGDSIFYESITKKLNFSSQKIIIDNFINSIKSNKKYNGILISILNGSSNLSLNKEQKTHMSTLNRKQEMSINHPFSKFYSSQAVLTA